MSSVSVAMAYFPYVFHPVTLVACGLTLLVYTEWRGQGSERAQLRTRLGVFALAGLLSAGPTVGYRLLTGHGPIETVQQGNAWPIDAIVGGGVAIVGGTMWLVWTRYGWGQLVARAAAALAVVTVPYVGLSPFWNVSGHVILSVVSTLPLVIVERRFWPLLAIPAVMVVNRPYVGAHTWAQSVGGLLLATVVVAGAFLAWPDTSPPE